MLPGRWLLLCSCYESQIQKPTRYFKGMFSFVPHRCIHRGTKRGIYCYIWKTLNNVLNGTETNHIYNLLRQSCSCFPFPIKCERLTPFCFRRIFFNDVYERWLQLRLDCYVMTSQHSLICRYRHLGYGPWFTNLYKSSQILPKA